MKKVGFTLPQEKILFFSLLKKRKKISEREIEEKKISPQTNEQKKYLFFWHKHLHV